MEKKSIKKSFKEGDIVKVPINDSEYTFMRKLMNFRVAFYDCKTDGDIEDLNYIIDRPILFITTVYKTDLKEGIWQKIGNIPLEEKLKKESPVFIKDIVPKGATPTYRIYENDKYRDASFEECRGIEPMIVCNAAYIKDRLNDIYYGNSDRMLKEYLMSR